MPESSSNKCQSSLYNFIPVGSFFSLEGLNYYYNVKQANLFSL